MFLDGNCSLNHSFEVSSVSLFEGTSSSDLELNTEDERLVTFPNNNAPEESLEQVCHLIEPKWAGLSAQDDICDLSEDEVESFDTFGHCPPNCKNDSSDWAVDSDIAEDWQFRDESLSYQEYIQNSMITDDDYRFFVIEYDSDVVA